MESESHSRSCLRCKREGRKGNASWRTATRLCSLRSSPCERRLSGRRWGKICEFLVARFLMLFPDNAKPGRVLTNYLRTTKRESLNRHRFLQHQVQAAQSTPSLSGPSQVMGCRGPCLPIASDDSQDTRHIGDKTMATQRLDYRCDFSLF